MQKLHSRCCHLPRRRLPSWQYVSLMPVLSFSPGIGGSVLIVFVLLGNYLPSQDGSSVLEAEATWDSSAHDSILLNRLTPSSQRIIITLQTSLEISSCESPARLSVDIPLRILARNDTGPGFFSGSFFSTSKRLTARSTLFSLKLAASKIMSQELWRLDTARCYVEGEGCLNGWMPRGLSVIHDALRLSTVERKSASVLATKALLSGIADESVVSNLTRQEADDLLRCVIARWTTYRFQPPVCSPPPLPFPPCSICPPILLSGYANLIPLVKTQRF